MDDYMLKVYGRNEYLAAESVLANYLYVHQCHKFDQDVHLSLVLVNNVKRIYARTQSDDDSIQEITPDDLLPQIFVCKFGDLSVESVNILLETFESELQKLRTDVKQNGGLNLQGQGTRIIQSVKAISSNLSSLESISLNDACNNLTEQCKVFGSYKREGINDMTIDHYAIPLTIPEILDDALIKVRKSLSQLINLYTKTFPVEFELDEQEDQKDKPEKPISPSMDTLLCNLSLCCKLPNEWLSIRQFVVVIQLWHGENRLAQVQSKTVSITKVFFYRLCFDEWIQFDLPLYSLPRETRVQIMLFSLKVNSNSDASPPPSPAPSPTPLGPEPEPTKTLLAFGSIPLFDYQHKMLQSSILIPLITDPTLVGQTFKGQQISLAIPTSSLTFDRDAPLIQLSFPELDYDLTFPEITFESSNNLSSLRKRFSSLDTITQSEINQMLGNFSHPLSEPLKNSEKEQIWERRYYLMDNPSALPKVLLCCHHSLWQCSSLGNTYSLITSWAQLTPVDAMQLLLPLFPDIILRRLTVKWTKQLSQDELFDYLPQLVESLKHEHHLNSPLIHLLLESSLSNVRICHKLYWLLKEQVNDPIFSYRSRIYINTLTSICGEATKKMIDKQEDLCTELNSISELVKSTKESNRLKVLQERLHSVNELLIRNSCCLPLSPSMQVNGLSTELCSYFTSNTLPLKLVFKCPESSSSSGLNLEALYKVGDDLRQDELTIQMIQIMDKLWLKNGLDLKIVTFGCVATDIRKGFYFITLF